MRAFARGSKLLPVAVFVALLQPSAMKAQARDTAAAKPATISGLVKDEYSDPLPKAEVVVQPGNYSATTDDKGRFRIEAPAGDYNIVFRRIGYAPEDFSWRANAGQGVELSIRLNPMPQALDTVVILDSHDKVAGASSISGTVFDKNMKTLSNVELQLLGTGRHATSYVKGEFFFAGLAKGDYVIRARRMGYSPTTVPIKIGGGEEHDLSVILAPLPNTLATVEIREKSGFGNSASVWEEFDRRQRWKTVNNFTVGRDILGRQGKAPLDVVLRGTQAQTVMDQKVGGYAPVSINSANSGGLQLPALVKPSNDDVCMLIDGMIGKRQPLSSFHADEVARIEVYAPNSDFTQTIGSRMWSVSGCEPIGFLHPLYFVIWTRSTT